MTFLYAVCSNEGRLQTELEWYDDLLSAEFEGNGAVDFKYMVSYSSRDSQEKPIKLVMYLQGKKPVSLYSNTFRLNTYGCWSGLHGSQRVF